MIGIPVENNDEFMVELESVQRAIIYNCPFLVNACIVPVMTRLPMLYVEAPSANTAVTDELYDIVQHVVKKHVFVKQEENQDEEVVIKDVDEDDEEFMIGPNKDGYRPLVVSFEKLEVDGDDNNVLFTVGRESEQTELLNNVLNEIRDKIEALGYETALPPDTTSSSNAWRPRVPFMRLPEKFIETLPPLEGGVEEFMREPDQGGNGISPILWCKWWEDVFAENVRMREIGVYARTPSRKGLDEAAFYIPHETASLPKGNKALTAAELRNRKYQEARMSDAENEVGSMADDIPDTTVSQARELFESLYEASSDEPSSDIPNIDTVDVNIEPPGTVAISGGTELDEWSKERMRKMVEERGSQQARKANLAPKSSDLPSIEDNPVFRDYREKRDQLVKAPIEYKKPKKELPPFPSQEHFLGAWRLVSSPIPSQDMINPGDSEASDNLILRVDGTTFGGPVLDRENMHKAAGGTWNNFQARWVGEEKESPSNPVMEQTRLRVRLVVPPAKERILVLEGEVKRLMMPSNLQETRSSFGIPMVEKSIQDAGVDYDNLLQCEGEMWVEDARTGENRKKLGSFLLMKVEGNSDPSDYIITIPRGVGNLD